MIKPIAIYGNPILRQICLPYTEGTNLTEIIKDLWETMYNAEGAGLAAPQIGIPHRLFIIDLPEQKWKKLFINPIIKELSGENVEMIEGCLSIPKIEVPVIRKDRVIINYYDENWIYIKEEYQGIRSRVIQHEYDHLEGKLWIDRWKPTPNQNILKVMTALQHCQTKSINVNYPII